ncbi:MAG TPA: hypothetical protein VGP18_02175 [Solirubrobacteraceae bacterium]|jgi:hypothetical protein|nr:hypothetical protein [Solirubrobacteraceae bacterium]
MRKASTRLALLGLAVAMLALPAVAGAAPVVTLKVHAVPIPKNPASNGGPTWPGTGNILGAGSALETEFTISGTEYGGFPSPLVGVAFYTPTGTKITSKGFTSCAASVLESHEVQNCPKKSIAGPKGEASGVVSFGGTRVHEKLTVQPFFEEGGNLGFYAEGREPAVIELLSTGKFTSASGSGPVVNAEVPLVSTVPGAPYGSVESIKVKVGAAFMQGKKLVSYGTIPKKCPKGGFSVKAELKFFSGETVTVTPKMPCPKK